MRLKYLSPHPHRFPSLRHRVNVTVHPGDGRSIPNGSTVELHPGDEITVRKTFPPHALLGPLEDPSHNNPEE